MPEINSQEIAKLAGVSRSTVSRVINNYPNVPERTRVKILDIIQKYNYYPNLNARVLAGKKTGTLGLFIIESGQVSGDSLSNFMITAVIESASNNGYYALTNVIRDPNNPETRKKIKEVFYQGRVDGGLFIGADNYEPIIEELIREGFVIGILDQDIAEKDEPNRIVYNLDNEKVAMKAIDYLVSLNHKKIGIILGNMKRIAGPQKYDGYLKGLKKHGLTINPNWILPGDFNRESGYMAIEELVRRDTEFPTAILAANDSVAFGAMEALQNHSMKVPDDISMIGTDDHLMSAYVKPALTTIKIDFPQIITKLTNSVIHVIENKEEMITSEIGAELIIRESCKSI
ncbi:LacI family DNA-binding transcriptional regulator [Aquibacillus albus]|uniref:LacI family transcriptional regulator n=1 Tax=Aquibacillus albus TaxID=1168171 RepID=A0ABS2MVT7_9BACI|nr:LacI family DNA-binding transcriptional regulator [Aquibacillus albus]MBM7569983.1 LacI family transcriptional regulator [Aquibacillus albus]